jgi:deoxyribodipyrimidine photolyase-related protein
MNKLIVFPHQLFDPYQLSELELDEIIIIEHPYFYQRLNFHKQKIILHFCSIREYQEELELAGYSVKLIDLAKAKNWRPNKQDDWLCFDPIEKKLQKTLKTWQKTTSLEVLESLNFLSSPEWLKEHFETHKWFMAKFYEEQRKHLQILVNENNKPLGGQWSFDEENRQKLPLKTIIPKNFNVPESRFYKEAIKFVKKNFPKNPGQIEEFIWPATRSQAESMFNHFLKHRFAQFGKFQDSIEQDQPFLFHSLISSSLNIGLLCPQYVVESALEYASKYEIPISSLEGFIRQIIGWREYVRAVYLFKGESMKKSNFWKFKKKKLSKKFYYANTGLLPLDNAIIRAQKYAYSHHIERLMVLGNFMLLTENHPAEVNRWFSEMYIDAYEWVMIANVFGMSQYADGGGIVTKPYISSSNYIRKMSHYKKDEWADIWDALYWHFVHKNRKILLKNQRYSMVMQNLSNMEAARLKEHLKIAKKFLKSI